VMNAELIEISAGRGYGVSEFREDLKAVVSKACSAAKKVVFFLSESQIMDEAFLQDINDLMCTGYVEGLFSDEELKALGEGIKSSAPSARNVELSNAHLQELVAIGVIDNLHVVLSLAPVGKHFMARLRRYPALTSWCTIEWYHPWPESALLDVARHHLTHLDAYDTPAASSPETEAAEAAQADAPEEAALSPASSRQRATTTQVVLLSKAEVVCKLCVAITGTVNEHVTRSSSNTKLVITPKFFVELLHLFKTMLLEQETRLKENLGRLRGGLDQLYACNGVVEKLHVELENLQPQIAEMTQETIALMGHLAADKEEADSIQIQVRREQNKVEDASRKCEVMKKAAQRELDAAMPAYAAALESLNTLKKSDIGEVKSFANPPVLVRKVSHG
jgi:dynein heavy chain